MQLNMEAWKKIINSACIGNVPEDWIEITTLVLTDGSVKYTFDILDGELYICPFEYNSYNLPGFYWSKNFTKDTINLVDEIKNYISNTTNDIIWTFERASEVVWNVNLQNPKIRHLVKDMINIETPKN